MHCAVCAEVLEELRLLDPKRVGYLCTNGHSFFTWREPFGRRQCMPKKVRPLGARATDVEILRYWLTNPVAREQLVDLLALACERLIEIVEGSADSKTEARRVADANLTRLATEGRTVELLRFCPTCGRPLTRYHDPENSWVDSMKCSAGHDFAFRGGTLWSIGGGAEFELWLFPRDAWLASSVDDAIGRSPEHWSTWEPIVHPQLRAALTRLRDQLPSR